MAAETERVGAKGGMEHSFGFTRVDEAQNSPWWTVCFILLLKIMIR